MRIGPEINHDVMIWKRNGRDGKKVAPGGAIEREHIGLRGKAPVIRVLECVIQPCFCIEMDQDPVCAVRLDPANDRTGSGAKQTKAYQRTKNDPGS